MLRSMRAICAIAFVFGLLTAGAPATADTIFESFEDGFGPWRARIGNPPIAWSVWPSTEQAQDGLSSLDFTADGRNDDGQVYMVRELQLPAGTWTIGLNYHLWSDGHNDLTSWYAIGFIGPYEPTMESDFTQTSYGERIDAITEDGWDSFSMQRTLSVSSLTTVYVAFGYDIVWETQRTHFFDSVTLTGVPIQCGNGTCFAGEDGCNCPADCGAPPVSESTCGDGKDNDCDGFPDCTDQDCSADPLCADVVCNGDLVCDPGEIACDCFTDCGAPPLHESVCDDGIDEDCDGYTDCDDLMDCGLQLVCMGTGDCDSDGTCEVGEDCNNCPTDCFAGSGASCGNGVCEIGDGEDCLSCPADCNGNQGGKPSGRYCCGDGAGTNPVGCGDARCTASGNTCTTEPAVGSCCGDAVCEGTEDEVNCAIDCSFTCSLDSQCADGDSCTIDTCDAGLCVNTPMDCDDADACTTDSCSGGTCVNDPITCNDGDECTTDTCDSVSGCVYTPIPGCTSCLSRGESCSSNDECCSNRCFKGVCK